MSSLLGELANAMERQDKVLQLVKAKVESISATQTTLAESTDWTWSKSPEEYK